MKNPVEIVRTYAKSREEALNRIKRNLTVVTKLVIKII